MNKRIIDNGHTDNSAKPETSKLLNQLTTKRINKK
jgi:hypothetical protein